MNIKHIDVVQCYNIVVELMCIPHIVYVYVDWHNTVCLNIMVGCYMHV